MRAQGRAGVDECEEVEGQAGAHVGKGHTLELDVEEDNIDAHVAGKSPEPEKDIG